ncbi:hypothetical protein EJB05_39225, partial [Eragrostis curvula]
MAADCLSALPDSVLLQVLSFLPAGAAARTSALSRRWRALWLQADAVNLDTRCYWDDDYDGGIAGRWLFRDAMAAVTAGGRCPVRSLSVRVVSSNHKDYCEDVMRTSPGLDAVLAAPATRNLEELRLVLRAEFDWLCDYELPTHRLPCASSLRVLELAGCALGPPAGGGGPVFGRLDTLSLASCQSPPANLQAVLDAAPNLAALLLDGFSFTAEEELGRDSHAVMRKRRLLLRCPRSLAAVTLLHCHGTDGLDLDALGVRFLRYEGYLEHFPFTSAATPPSGMPVNLQHAELRFCRRCCNPPSTKARPHAKFWESIGSFGRLRFLKLKLLDINDIAVHPEQEATFLKEFPDLKYLELKGSYEDDKLGAAVAIANFLHCCPALQELRLKFKIHGDLYAWPMPKRIDLSEGRKAQLGLEKSIELLKRLRSETSSTSAGYAVHDDDRCCDDVDLSALQARRFPCLESRLRKIRLKFELEDFNCFEVKIAKFLVENALVLEAMQVHDGDQRVHDHIHRKLAMWRADSSNSKIDIVGEKVKTRPRWWKT